MILLTSGAMIKYFSYLLALLVIPFIPPKTFIGQFSCSMMWSAPKAVNGTGVLFTEKQPLSTNSLYHSPFL